MNGTRSSIDGSTTRRPTNQGTGIWSVSQSVVSRFFRAASSDSSGFSRRAPYFARRSS